MLLYDLKMTYDDKQAPEIRKTKKQFMENVEMFNNILGMNRLGEPLKFFIYQAAPGTFGMVCAVSELQKPSTAKLEKILKEVLEDLYSIRGIKVSDLREITVDNFRQLLSRGENSDLVNTYRVINELNLDYDGNNSFSVSETIGKTTRMTFNQAVQHAQKLMPDQTLLDELKRIYSDRNDRKKFYGMPVHYKIMAGSHSSAMEMAKLLVNALYVNKRLVGSRIVRAYDITPNCYGEEDFENLMRQAEGSTVLIELQGANGESTNYASSYEAVVEFIADMVRKYQRNTQCIFIESAENPGFAPKLISTLQDDMTIIELQEGAGDRAQAFKYLKELEQKSDMNFYSDEELEQALGDKESFRASDIYKVHDKLYSGSLKNKIYLAYKDIEAISAVESSDAQKPSAYRTLQEMVGLKEQKELIEQILASHKMMKLRLDMGLKRQTMTRHMCFMGNPGSAKTTVARLLTDILNKEGVLRTGRFVECGRGDLVGEYVGWTAKIVQKKFRQARGGVLFIDEAYSLVDDEHGLYGDEAINTIVQEMENKRNQVIVIFAGYTDRMKEFLDRNEGLRSRIAFHLNFPDYGADELVDILKLMIKNKKYTASDEVFDECRKIFVQASKHKNFGNGRFVRNLLEQAMMKQDQRLFKQGGDLTREQLLELKVEDFDVNTSEMYRADKSKVMGFAPRIIGAKKVLQSEKECARL
ncbi:MAG: AAA family ATPase [Selenomonadaceae bacterium]|nr:AAA family ATPase [Selenomonadaceae bacterium]